MSDSSDSSVKGLEVGSDEQALLKAAQGDREAFGLLYDRHFDRVYNYIMRRVGDQELAEDITAAVWERALKAIERYELRGVPFAAWLYRIAGNLVANHHRRARLLRFVPLNRRPASRSQPQARWDDRETVRSALSRLSEADQEVIGLFYYAGLTPAEMSAVLDCSIAAVHKRLHRARNRLKQRLETETDG